MFKYVFLGILAVTVYFHFYFDVPMTNELIGTLFAVGVLVLFAVFVCFKFGLHYKIQSLNRFATAFYYSVFEYKQTQTTPSGVSYMDSVREQAEVALAANFDSTLKASDLKIPPNLYSGKDPILEKLRARIKEAERIKLEARHLDHKANVMMGKTQDMMVENDLAQRSRGKFLDEMFDIQKGVAAIVDMTVDEVKDQGYERTPDYEIITRIAFENNPTFSTTYRFFDADDVQGVLFRSPFMIILVGIIGTFAGFYLALSQGGDIKSGAAVAIISSLFALPVSLTMDYINTLYPDNTRYRQAFDTYMMSLEVLFKHEQDLYNIDPGKRPNASQPEGGVDPAALAAARQSGAGEQHTPPPH